MKKRFFTRTSVLIGVALTMTVGIAGWFFVRNGADDIETLTVEPQDFLQQISVSGNVVASERVDLAFSQTGQIALVHARVGDTVRAGSVLVVLENGEARAEVAQKQAALKAAQAKLESLREGTRQEQLAVDESKVASAQAALRKTLMIAPFDGIVTNVEAKVGEAASLSVSAITMISAGTLLIESFVPELNAPLLEVGDEAHVTLDAYGADMIFAATVLSLDPAETIRDGVTTYRAKLGFHENDERIKPGMNAALVITTEKKSNVIAIPQGIIDEQDNKKIVRVKEGKAIRERIIEIGSISSHTIMKIFQELHKKGQTIIMVTHEPQYARLAERIITLDDGAMVMV
jgi:multidrug efflux pump subunit AcrA (membrane-fusion protein)